MIDKSVVAIFDIEGFTKNNPEKQAKILRSFMDTLGNHLDILEGLHPTVFSIGDGAIVSLGRSCEVDKSAVNHFLDFIIEFTKDLLSNGPFVRVAVNFALKDRVMSLTESDPIYGEYIQIGDAINNATRILSFCETGEIMFSSSFVEYLRSLDIENTIPLLPNKQLLTKHGQKLNTFTYNPPEPNRSIFYTPDSPVHPYKKFASFPPITTSTLNYFIENGLDLELRKVVSNAYDTMLYINDTMTFLSWNVVLKVLLQLRYDPEDKVYVLSRDDHTAGFWTQPIKDTYIGYLDEHKRESGGYINQTRVMVYDKAKYPDTKLILEKKEFKQKGDIYFDLVRLHNTQSYYSFPNTLLFKYEKLNELLFGFTLSKKHKFAIIPVPALKEIDAHELHIGNIGDLIQKNKDYKAKDGPMKAIITADENYINSLCHEMDSLINSSDTYMLK